MSLPVRVLPRDNNSPELKAQTRDVSYRGLYFHAEARFEKGTEIDFVLTLPQQIVSAGDVNIKCHGKVVRVDTSDDGINAYPDNYKTDIMAAMHAYLNDPTGIKEAAISVPLLKPVGKNTHYVACLHFNGKMNGTSYAGPKDVAAVFLAGRFDQFVETPKDLCAGVTYAAFPELEKLSR